MKLGRGGNAGQVCRAAGRLNLHAPLRALAFGGQASLLFRERLLAGPVEMGSLRNILPCPRRLPPPKHLPPPPPDIPPSTTTSLHGHISPLYSPAWLSDASWTSLVRLCPLLYHVEATTTLCRPKQPPRPLTPLPRRPRLSCFRPIPASSSSASAFPILTPRFCGGALHF